MIPLPVRRCSNCGFVGRTASFEVEADGPLAPRTLVCPRCGAEVGRLDPRLQ